MDPYLSLVLAAATFVRVSLDVGYDDESAQVTDAHLVGIRHIVETLVQELGSSVGNLTVTLHLTKPQATVTASNIWRVREK